MEIRRIRLDEAPAIAEIYASEYARGAAARPIEDWLANCALSPKAFCLLAEEDREIVGFVIASVIESPVMPGQGAELEELHVRVRGREAEIGRALAEAAMSRVLRRGSWTVRVDVDPDAPAWTRELYRSLGFVHDADRFSLYHE